MLNRCDSMSEICEGKRGLDGKLNHLVLDSAPAKSTVGNGLHESKEDFFKEINFSLNILNPFYQSATLIMLYKPLATVPPFPVILCQ